MPATKETPPAPVGTTIQMAVETPESAYESEDEAEAQPASALHVAPYGVVAGPEETDEDEDADADDDVATASIEPTHHEEPLHQVSSNAAATDGDRWAGTMSHEWNENEKQTGPDLPDLAPKPKTRAKPKITVAQATKMIPADALEYLRENFKTDVQHIRSYDPANNVKNPVVAHKTVVEEKEDDLPDSES